MALNWHLHMQNESHSFASNDTPHKIECEMNNLRFKKENTIDYYYQYLYGNFAGIKCEKDIEYDLLFQTEIFPGSFELFGISKLVKSSKSKTLFCFRSPRFFSVWFTRLFSIRDQSRTDFIIKRLSHKTIEMATSKC